MHALQYVPGGGGGGGLQYVSGGGVSASCLDNSLAQDLVWVATDDRRYNHKKQENQNRFFFNSQSQSCCNLNIELPKTFRNN